MHPREMGVRLGEALSALLQSGFQLPVTAAAVGRNGSLLTVAFTGGDVDVVAEHLVDDCFVMPVNVMFVDAAGEAARLRMENIEGASN